MERRFAALLSADIERFSIYMGDNEEATVNTLIDYREILRACCERFGGWIVDSPGDNVLAEFPNAVDAVASAIEIQDEIVAYCTSPTAQQRMRLRMGVNVGEVIVHDHRIYGEAIIIAARLEGLAQGGGICISGRVFDQINGKLPVSCSFLGNQQVKHIVKPVRVYRIDVESEPEETFEVMMPDVTEEPSRSILIVENESIWQTSLTSMFTRVGFEVAHAFDYSDVLTQLARPHALPDLAIVDLNLPNSQTQEDFDGLRVLAALRRKGVYAIVVSGYIREVVDSISDRPEICDVVDKVRFADDGFTEYFLAKVEKAMALAEANQRTEGKLPEQQVRLRQLPPVDCVTS